jgi:predicted acylesterase/phospholipase RssA
VTDYKFSARDIEYMVFQGGGGKGAAYYSLLKAMQAPEINLMKFKEKQPISAKFGYVNAQEPTKYLNFAGSSAGGLTAASLACGLTPDELKALFTSKKFLEYFPDFDNTRTQVFNNVKIAYHYSSPMSWFFESYFKGKLLNQNYDQKKIVTELSCYRVHRYIPEIERYITGLVYFNGDSNGGSTLTESTVNSSMLAEGLDQFLMAKLLYDLFPGIALTIINQFLTLTLGPLFSAIALSKIDINLEELFYSKSPPIDQFTAPFNNETLYKRFVNPVTLANILFHGCLFSGKETRKVAFDILASKSYNIASISNNYTDPIYEFKYAIAGKFSYLKGLVLAEVKYFTAISGMSQTIKLLLTKQVNKPKDTSSNRVLSEQIGYNEVKPLGGQYTKSQPSNHEFKFKNAMQFQTAFNLEVTSLDGASINIGSTENRLTVLDELAFRLPYYNESQLIIVSEFCDLEASKSCSSIQANSQIFDSTAEAAFKEFALSNDAKESISSVKPNPIEEFTFKKLASISHSNLVLTGSNISNGHPLYFSNNKTPNFPVCEAVAITQNFPFLWKPIVGLYPRDDTNQYLTYSGFLVDGGLLNNLPMNAFDRDTEPTGGQSIILSGKLIGFSLDSGFSEFNEGGARHPYRPSAWALPKSIIAVLMEQMDFSKISIQEANLIVDLSFGKLSLFNFIPTEEMLNDVEMAKYNEKALKIKLNIS